jgi:hypothetical protein
LVGLLALWALQQKCMHELWGDCPLSGFGPPKTTDVVLKLVPYSHRKESVTLTFHHLVGEDTTFGDLAVLFDFPDMEPVSNRAAHHRSKIQ